MRKSLREEIDGPERNTIRYVWEKLKSGNENDEYAEARRLQRDAVTRKENKSHHGEQQYGDPM
jgi:hypothetical protein